MEGKSSPVPATRLLNEAGIIGALGLYGVAQERILAVPYGSEFFKFTFFLLLINRLIAIVYTLAMIRCKGEDYGTKAPLWKYLAISLSTVSASACQYEALKYVSFPVQMLGKSFKMMPVMLWSIAIARKSYGVREWTIALMITWGVSQFLLTGDITPNRAQSETSSYGLILLLAFLGFDGFTSTFQEKLFKDHQTSTYNQMLYVNIGSSLVCLGSLANSGDLLRAFGFCVQHQEVLVHIASLSVAAVAAQYLIYTEVKHFGALALAATMNLRQVLSILMSYLYFRHTITVLQFIGMVIIFSALFYKTHHAWKSQHARRSEDEAGKTAGGPAETKLGNVDIADEETGETLQDTERTKLTEAACTAESEDGEVGKGSKPHAFFRARAGPAHVWSCRERGGYLNVTAAGGS